MAITQPSSTSPLLLGSGGQMLSPGTGSGSLTAPTVQGVNGTFQFLLNGSLQALQQAEAQAAGTVLPPAGENLPDAPAPEVELLPDERATDQSEPPLLTSEQTGEPRPEDPETKMPINEIPVDKIPADEVLVDAASEKAASEESKRVVIGTSLMEKAGGSESAEGQPAASGPGKNGTAANTRDLAVSPLTSQAGRSEESGGAVRSPESLTPPPLSENQQVQQQQQQRQAVARGISGIAKSAVQSNTVSQRQPEAGPLGDGRSAAGEGARLPTEALHEGASVQSPAQAGVSPVIGQALQQGENVEGSAGNLSDSTLAVQRQSADHRLDDTARADRQLQPDERTRATSAPVTRLLAAEEGQEGAQSIGAGLRTGSDLAAGRAQAEVNAGRGDLAAQAPGSQGQSMGGGEEGESSSRRHESPQTQAQAAGGRQGSHAGAASPPPFSLVQQTLLSPHWGRGMGERAIMMAQHGPRVAHIQLDPPELGAMQIRIHMHGGDQVSVSFSSPNPMVREALEQQMPRLRDMFADQGLNLQDLSVTDQSSGQQSGQHEQAEQGRNEGRYGAGDPTPVEAAPAPGAVPVGLVDYYA